MMTSHSTETRSPEHRAARKSPEKGKGKRRLGAYLALAAVLAAAAIVIALAMGVGRSTPDTTLRFNGRVEGSETRIGVRMPARVKSVAVKQGDQVREGELLLSLDSQDVLAKLRGAGSGVTIAAETERAARLKGEALDNAARKVASPGVLGKLFGGSKRKAELEKLRMGAEEARAQQRIAHAELSRARAARDEVSANLSYFNIKSPIDGVCMTRSVEPGDLVNPGQTLLTVVNLGSVSLKGFIPESELARVKIGQPATVILDAAPSTPLSARVTSIDSEPSFTPENIYFKEDRVKQVFGVELSLDNRRRLAKPGMSAEAIIKQATPERP